MTRKDLSGLRHALRALRASITGLGDVIHRARYPDLLLLELNRLKKSEGELEKRIAAERAAIDEPHRFLPNPRLPAALNKWCFRCGATKDREEFHPAELQVNEQSARAAQGGA